MIAIEHAALEMLAEGKISVDESGKIWKHWDGRKRGHWLVAPREMKSHLCPGQKYLHISFGLNGYIHEIRTHRLVWLAFYGAIPDELQINQVYNSINC